MSNPKALPSGEQSYLPPARPGAPPALNGAELFGLSTYRIPGGYCAQVRVKTNKGSVVFNADATRYEYVQGLQDDPPKAAAMKEALDQAKAFIETPTGRRVVPGKAKDAIETVRMTRELVERAQAGDPEARVGLRYIAKSKHRGLRKALHAQRMFEE